MVFRLAWFGCTKDQTKLDGKHARAKVLIVPLDKIDQLYIYAID